MPREEERIRKQIVKDYEKKGFSHKKAESISYGTMHNKFGWIKGKK